MADNFKLIGAILVCLFSLFLILALPDWVYNYISSEILVIIWVIFLMIVMFILMRD